MDVPEGCVLVRVDASWMSGEGPLGIVEAVGAGVHGSLLGQRVSAQSKPLPHVPPTVSFAPIGVLRSVFRERHGTPRQSHLCPLARATLRLHPSLRLNACHALESLDAWSHVWLLSYFHANTNDERMQGLFHNVQTPVLHAKVHPPRLDGCAVGLFATRTPHRPNPIGLSLARLDRIEGDTLYLSGVDLIDRTPILDVKPFLPAYDTVSPQEDVSTPPWMEAPFLGGASQVEFADGVQEALEQITPYLEFYNTAEEAATAIKQVLMQDIRSVHNRKKHGEGGMFGVCLDVMNVVFTVVDEGDPETAQPRTFRVLRIERWGPL